jgi:hypothetical protein
MLSFSGGRPVVDFPVKFNRIRLGKPGPVPRLGEHNKGKASIIKRDMVEHLIIGEELPKILHGYNDTYTVNTSANDLAVIQFSSGTTGSPKPVYYNHIAATLTAVNIKFCIGNLSAAPLVYRRIIISGKFDHHKLKSLRRMTFSGGATDMDTIQCQAGKHGESHARHKSRHSFQANKNIAAFSISLIKFSGQRKRWFCSWYWRA